MQSNTAEIESLMAASKRQFLVENLKPGETYSGLLLGENGAPDEHVFLLPGELLDADWDKSMAWAEKNGGVLPTRRQQSLLIANLKSHFKPRYYWSCEQHADYPTNAWLQYFYDGYQNYLRKSYAGAARAVRRLPIQ
ncbi:DUF1566 domain-containing protein [Duganella violaceipulchra]|uniref:DUF1566 domain-containing protein n=1 Tax=Duganella violaceipulchra TaxID=2849652 RepID=A0AA41H5F8_9BURK|nr:DUF1566 domain-containing protein [Duganella violaceicalia]MBV6321967.1 DUF1566 domain-containing protein [Duganella violaceicalia]MCP2007037.1 hypothetical protein [Duganella violaceicalia]